MSINVKFIQQYIAEVYRQYQKGSVLSNVVSQPKRIVGNVAYFQRADKIMAQDFNRGSPIQYQNTNYEQIPCLLKDKIVADMVYDLDVDKTNIKEAQVLAGNIADALGRAADQEIIDEGLSTTNTDIVGTTTDIIDVNYIKRLKAMMDRKAVPQQGRKLVWTPDQEVQFLTSLTNEENSNFKTLRVDEANGDVKGYMGFEIIKIEDRDEGGLPKYTDEDNNTGQKGFAFHTTSVGKAIATPETSSMLVERVANMAGYQYSGKFSLGATKIWDVGIIPFVTKINAENMASRRDKIDALLEQLVASNIAIQNSIVGGS